MSTLAPPTGPAVDMPAPRKRCSTLRQLAEEQGDRWEKRMQALNLTKKSTS